MKRLIVNADDFGFTRDVNEGIVEAHCHGILTACTLMANGAAFNHAVMLALANPTLDVGCHLVFVQGRSVMDPGRELPDGIGGLRWGMPFYEEGVAQVRKLLAAGIRPSHLDTHKHTHLFPPVLRAVAQVAREFYIPWVRRPFDLAPRSAVSIATHAMRPMFARALRGLRATDYFTGLQLTGRLDEASLTQLLREVPEGLTELMCHPGLMGGELPSARTRLKDSRAIELRALLSPAVRRAVEEQRIALVNYLGEMR